MTHTALTTCLMLTLLLFLPRTTSAQPTCIAPSLSDQQIKDMVARARVTDTSLPAPFPQFTTEIRKHGCHYVYIEDPIPLVHHRSNLFTLNQYGAIVDTEPRQMACTDRTFTDAELAEIVRKERAARKDLPAPFPEFTTSVDRLRCLYLYYENPVPFRPAHFQVFVIDPLGELLEAFINKPKEALPR